MNDLLSDSFEIPRDQSSRNGDIEMGNQRSTNLERELKHFFTLARGIEKELTQLETLLVEIEKAHEHSKGITKASAMKEITKQIARDIDKVGKIAVSLKSKFEVVDKDNIASRSKPECHKGSAPDRTRTTTTASLKKKFKDNITRLQNIKERILREKHEIVERRVFTVTGTRPDEETIDKLIETGSSEQIFQKAITEQGRGQVMGTIAEIQEQHDAVKELEEKLLGLQQIFMDLAVLVHAQGDMLDNIESQVSTAVDHVQSGSVALQKAKKLQRNSRKWMCIAIIIFVIIAAVIIVGILKPWKSDKGA